MFSDTDLESIGWVDGVGNNAETHKSPGRKWGTSFSTDPSVTRVGVVALVSEDSQEHRCIVKVDGKVVSKNSTAGSDRYLECTAEFTDK